MSLTDKQIIKLAGDNSFSLYLYGPLRLTNNGDGTISFKKSEELTPFAHKLIAFVRVLEGINAD